MPIESRPYQTLAIDAFIQDQRRRKLVVLSTGMGKTILGLKLAQKMNARTLWLAHREELITQPQKALALVWPEATSGIVKADLNQYMRQIVFASVQSAQQPKRIEQLAAQRFDLVVIDEAHHALSPGYRAILEALGCNRIDGPQTLGLTATPERSDNGALSDVFEGIVFQMGISVAIAGGYLVAPTVVERPINLNLDTLTVSRGDYGAKDLDVALMQAGIVSEICAAYEEHCAGRRKTLIFVVSVAQAEAVAVALKERGHAVEALSGETDTHTRQRTLKRLKTGEIECVVNCMVLTEGFDEPSVDCVILGRPTQSKPLMIQKVGRALRLFPGKTSALVVDMVGASNRHTMVQAAVLFGIRPDPNEVKRAAGVFDPITEPEEYWKQRLMSQIKGVGGAPRSKLRWVAGENGGWLLAAGSFGTVRMTPTGEEWLVDVVGIQDEEAGLTRIVLAPTPVPMDIAQAFAEDYVRRVKAVTLARGDARWRDGEASEGQVKLLKRAGVKNADQLTKGTAADLITQVKAKQETEPATSKQIYFLRRAGAQVSDTITKKEASRMIGKLRSAT